MTAADREEPYSADRIAYGQPVRRPFLHNGELWVCTSVTGSGLTTSGSTEHEAYRIIPESLFSGVLTTYGIKTSTDETAEAARNDPDGFYHGVTVKHGRETFVLCGPPRRFVTEEAGPRPEPAQLNLF